MAWEIFLMVILRMYKYSSHLLCRKIIMPLPDNWTCNLGSHVSAIVSSKCFFLCWAVGIGIGRA